MHIYIFRDLHYPNVLCQHENFNPTSYKYEVCSVFTSQLSSKIAHHNFLGFCFDPSLYQYHCKGLSWLWIIVEENWVGCRAEASFKSHNEIGQLPALILVKWPLTGFRENTETHTPPAQFLSSSISNSPLAVLTFGLSRDHSVALSSLLPEVMHINQPHRCQSLPMKSTRKPNRKSLLAPCTCLFAPKRAPPHLHRTVQMDWGFPQHTGAHTAEVWFSLMQQK